MTALKLETLQKVVNLLMGVVFINILLSYRRAKKHSRRMKRVSKSEDLTTGGYASFIEKELSATGWLMGQFARQVRHCQHLSLLESRCNESQGGIS